MADVPRRMMSMTAGVTLGVTAAVVGAVAGGAYLVFRHHEAHVLRAARRTAQVDAEMIQLALEHQMLENDRVLLRQMVESFAQDPSIARVMILDRRGIVRVAGGRPPRETTLAMGSPTCQACHAASPRPRNTRTVLETDGGSVLRAVLPLPNRPSCHRCHVPAHAINGLLVVDLAAGPVVDALRGDLVWFVGVSGALVLVLLGSIALVVRMLVMRRLRRLEQTARAIAGGDLARRVPIDGDDTLNWLGREFNHLADSTTRLLDEQERQRAQLETVLNGVDDGILVLDPELRVVAANDALLARLGRSREDVLGRPCPEALREPCAAGCPDPDSPGGLHDGTTIIARPGADGRLRHEEVRLSTIRGPAGRPAYLVEVWRDITERRAQEAHMAEAHRLASLGLLASGFSHELNTPLASALTCIEGVLAGAGAALPDAEGEPGRARRSLRLAREQLLRCRGITQHFLRLSSGRESASDIVDAAAVVASVVQLVQPTAREAGVALHVDAGTAPATVRADDARLEQVLLNVVINALQACTRGGTVQVAVLRGERDVRIRVRDDGRGIPPDGLRRIFEPFYSQRPGGTGLGLFLSLNFVREWGGDIEVSSKVGRGSTFDVILPVRGAPPAASTTHGQDDQPAARR